MVEYHAHEGEVAHAFRQASAALNGLSISDCQDITVGLLASVIVSHYRQAGMPLSLALECADAAIEDVKEAVLANWGQTP